MGELATGSTTRIRDESVITCYLRYAIDPDKITEFETYARQWVPLVERFGGTHHGYFLPHESANDVAIALFSFASLADYETYRVNCANDNDCKAAYQFGKSSGCIRRYDRQFLKPLEFG